MAKIIQVRFAQLILLAVSLPFFSLTICIVAAMILHWEETTGTHCKVHNYLPSISSAVGVGTPERYIWRIGIGLHSFLRFTIAYLYYQFYQEGLPKDSSYMSTLVKVTIATHVIENSCLLLMTFISSTENYELHKFSFIGFFAFAMIYMLLTCFLFIKLGRIRYSQKNAYSCRLKVILFVMKIVFFFFCMYFFWRHNKYCETGIYSLFAFFEYCVVLMNIMFHGTAIYDFKDTIIEVGSLTPHSPHDTKEEVSIYKCPKSH